LRKAIQPQPQIINGVIFASYESDGLIYRASAIEQRQEVLIVSFAANQSKKIDLNCL
jgi:hypothetical protein